MKGFTGLPVLVTMREYRILPGHNLRFSLPRPKFSKGLRVPKTMSRGTTRGAAHLRGSETLSFGLLRSTARPNVAQYQE